MKKTRDIHSQMHYLRKRSLINSSQVTYSRPPRRIQNQQVSEFPHMTFPVGVKFTFTFVITPFDASNQMFRIRALQTRMLSYVK